MKCQMCAKFHRIRPRLFFVLLGPPYSTPGRSQINCQRGIIDGRPAGPQQAFDFLKQSNWAFLSVYIHSRYCGTVQQGVKPQSNS